MTLKELSQLYWLNREIEMYDKKRSELRARAISPSTANLSDMPRIHGDGTCKVERLAAEIADLSAIIDAMHERCMHERNRLERYIAGIPDSYIRQIFQYRFVSGLSWWQVAYHIGGNNTADSVRKACMRYLERESDSTPTPSP